MAFNQVQWDGVYSGFNGVEFTQDCPEKGNIVKQFEFVVIFLASLFLHVFTVPVWGGLAYGGMVFSNI